MLTDIAMILVGVLLIARPVSGMLTLTLLVTVFLAAEAFVDFYIAFALRAGVPGKGWLVLTGVANLVIAALIFSGWPLTAAWAIGLLVGVSLLLRGFATIMTALALRQ